MTPDPTPADRRDDPVRSGELLARFGSARRPARPVVHARPEGTDDATVSAVGRLSAAFEVIENARGMLYAFHRMSGEADLALQDALSALRDAGHEDLADEVDEVLVGRDVVRDMWTFQIVETYDEQYYRVFRDVNATVARRLLGTEGHVFESEMKRHEQTGEHREEDRGGGSDGSSSGG